MYRQAKEPIGDDPAKGLVALSDNWLRPHRCVESKEDWERFCDERVEPAVVKVLTAAASRSCPRILRWTDSSSSTGG